MRQHADNFRVDVESGIEARKTLMSMVVRAERDLLHVGYGVMVWGCGVLGKVSRQVLVKGRDVIGRRSNSVGGLESSS